MHRGNRNRWAITPPQCVNWSLPADMRQDTEPPAKRVAPLVGQRSGRVLTHRAKALMAHVIASR